MKRKRKGFTLIEMAVIILIIGLVAGASVATYQVLMGYYITKEAKSVVNFAEGEIINFVKRYKRLPTADEFDNMTHKSLSRHTLALQYYVKTDIVNFTDKEQYCGYDYRYGGGAYDFTIEYIDTDTYLVLKPYAFSLAYTSDQASRSISQEIYRKTYNYNTFMEDMNCVRGSAPEIVNTSLPPIYLGQPYYGSLQFNYTAISENYTDPGQEHYICFELRLVPDNITARTYLVDYFSANKVGSTGNCNSFVGNIYSYAMVPTANMVYPGSDGYMIGSKTEPFDMFFTETLILKAFIRDNRTGVRPVRSKEFQIMLR